MRLLARDLPERARGRRRSRAATSGARRAHGVPAAILDTDPIAVARADADVVVECLGGVEPARSAIATALAAGRHVVTANKLVLAEHGAELQRLAAARGVRLLCSAAVGGSAPVLERLAALQRKRASSPRGAQRHREPRAGAHRRRRRAGGRSRRSAFTGSDRGRLDPRPRRPRRGGQAALDRRRTRRGLLSPSSASRSGAPVRAACAPRPSAGSACARSRSWPSRPPARARASASPCSRATTRSSISPTRPTPPCCSARKARSNARLVAAPAAGPPPSRSSAISSSSRATGARPSQPTAWGVRP